MRHPINRARDSVFWRQRQLNEADVGSQRLNFNNCWSCRYYSYHCCRLGTMELAWYQVASGKHEPFLKSWTVYKRRRQVPSDCPNVAESTSHYRTNVPWSSLNFAMFTRPQFLPPALKRQNECIHLVQFSGVALLRVLVEAAASLLPFLHCDRIVRQTWEKYYVSKNDGHTPQWQ